uniref:Putative transketolase domain containing protein n=1 Tax=viral metagenome TaxID=1070528 RepID=A0A6H1ZDI4_9ZZZZ
MDFRKPFVDKLIELVGQDDRTVFITMDVGFSFLEPLKKRLRNRFFNFGITENASTAIAAGLAKEGMRVYVYSMIPFVIFRPYEIVRNLIAMPENNVKMLGVSGSAAYAMLGYSHNMLDDEEDVRLAVGLPGLNIIIPNNEKEAEDAAIEAFSNDLPYYVRL